MRRVSGEPREESAFRCSQGRRCAELGVDVLEDPEFWPTHVSPHLRFSLRLWWSELRWDDLPGNQSGKLVTCHFGKRIQVAHLLLKIFIGTPKPEALSCAPVNTQRSTDGIAVPARLQHIVLGEDLDSFPPPASLDRDTQAQGKAANVDSAVPAGSGSARNIQRCPPR